MRFHITTAYHSPQSQETLKDIVGPIACGLHELGHVCSAGDFYSSDAVNILLECFPPAEAHMIKTGGYRYGIGLIGPG